jgi:mannose-6-phosphate isomerase-like protein (cupin superfamily)
VNRRTVISIDQAKTGPNRDVGTYRWLLTEESCGATRFMLCVNSLKAGVTTPALPRKSEQGWYVLSGRGWFTLNGVRHRITPGMGIHAPAGGEPHMFEVDAEEDLTYVIVFAPPL